VKCIALTYDDGPFPDTSRLARIMRREKVKATFFMLGENVQRYPEAVKDVQATGSELANHSWNHPSLPGLSNSGMRSQLNRTSQEIEKVSGLKVSLMRPPYGANNQRLDQVSKKLGLAEIFWTVDTLDWKYQDTDRLVDYVLDNAGRDDVVLMHDIHESTVDGARAIFRGLKKRGYTLVTVSELYPKLRPGGHYPLYQGRGFAKKSDYPKR
jgi:peptidoglycan-N-acetylglucosamine deacetylase